MFAAIGFPACPNLAVPAQVMSHVVDVESGANPYAIGVVGGQLARQPRNLAEALATVHMLDAKGYNYSLGVAQVNRANLGKYGLDSYAKAFDACSNLAAGAKILAACYAGSGGNWGKAFSCYYSGDFVTGYRDGYVQKVYDSINRGRNTATGPDDFHAIPLASPATAAATGSDKNPAWPPGSPGYRTAIRSVAFYATTATATGVAAKPDAPSPPSTATRKTSGQAAAPQAAPIGHATASTVFVPQVTGPDDPPGSPTSAAPISAPEIAATAAPGGTPSMPAKEMRDAAFVF